MVCQSTEAPYFSGIVKAMPSCVGSSLSVAVSRYLLGSCHEEQFLFIADAEEFFVSSPFKRFLVRQWIRYCQSTQACFCFRIQRNACPQWYMLCVSHGFGLVVDARVVQVVFHARCVHLARVGRWCLVIATGRLSLSCEQLLVDSDMLFPVATVSTWTTSVLSPRSFPCARRPVTVPSAM